MRRIPDKIVFIDFDGVMTAVDQTPGSYLSHDNSEYGASASCLENLRKLVEITGAKVIISSNWRKFDDDGPYSYWRHSLGTFQNPLPKFKQQISDFYYDMLPPIRHMRKSDVLEAWMRQNEIDEKSTKFVIFDDDPDEGFRHKCEFNIKNHFIMTDGQRGLSEDDLKKAVKILEN